MAAGYSLVHALLVVLGEAVLERVILVSRHGERQRLRKHASTLSEAGSADGGPGLTQLGIRHMKSVGTELQRRYFPPGCHNDRRMCLDGSSPAYAPEKVWVESSGLDRSLMSAVALHDNLWVDMNVTGGLSVPVHSRRDADDHVLRAYTKCPSLSAGIARWAQSSEFHSRENMSSGLRERVAKALKDSGAEYPHVNISGSLPLLDWWNAFDALMSYNAQTRKVPVSPQDFAAAAKLVAWLESRKFGMDISQNLCGGALLGEIALRLSADKHAPRLVHYSAHYPTMLCLLSAMGMEEKHHSWLYSNMMPAGSVLAFELHRADRFGSWNAINSWVHLKYWNGSVRPDSLRLPEWHELTLPCATKRTEHPLSQSCQLGEFSDIASRRSFRSVASWCMACNNTEMPACQGLHMTCPTKPDLVEAASGTAGISTSVVAVVASLVGLVAGACSVVLLRRLSGATQGHLRFEDEKPPIPGRSPTRIGTV